MNTRSFLFLFLALPLAFCTENNEDLSNIEQPVPDFLEGQSIDLPEVPYNYSAIELPAHLTNNALQGPDQSAAIENDNTPDYNQLTDDGATLGRVLFYDKKLSANGTISCASCHKQDMGFSDEAVFSRGFEGGTTRRHSMSLVNAIWYSRGKFFWDERAATLEDQVLMPFQDEVEMGMTLDEVVTAVQSQEFYAALFKNAFGSEEIDSEKISFALAQFVRSMVSVNSKYDAGRIQVNDPQSDFPNFTESENAGKRLFFDPVSQGGASCAGCHSTEAFINPDRLLNNGLDAESTEDNGAFEATSDPDLIGAFKTPSLKSIALTAPYMHDGRFTTLEEVIEHYNSGIQNHPNLSRILKNPRTNQPIRMNLDEQEKADLVAFLNTLTDESLASDERFSDPFVVEN
jgi:cytochrome c peroxidase